MVKPAQRESYAESMLKGRMAETLVEELLRASGNEVYRFGYEAVLQNLTQIQDRFDRLNKASERIRIFPDFIVLDRKGGPAFVEVKFRWDSRLDQEGDIKRLERLHADWDAKLVIVNCFQKPYFRIADPPYRDEKRGLLLRPLLAEANWKIKRELYEDAERLVEKYLSPTLISLRHKALNL